MAQPNIIFITCKAMYAQKMQQKILSSCGVSPEIIIPNPHAETVLDTNNHLKISAKAVLAVRHIVSSTSIQVVVEKCLWVDKANLTFVYPTQHIHVIDITGRVVDSFVTQDAYFANWEPRLDIPNGLYFIISDNKQNSYLKVLLQR